MKPSLTGVTCVTATFVKLRGFVFNVTKRVARALIINLFDNLALKINLVKNVTC
jgi:hypothetical protein